MREPSVGERLRYWFDGVMSRGLVALISLLALASLAFIAVVSIVVVVLGFVPPSGKMGFGEALWASLMRTLDPGTMGGDEGPKFRAAMLIVTLGGLILVASLIGIVSNAFDARVDQLRKGRSRVLETDHTLILGWSTKVFSIVNEICIANESRRRAVIVILADRDKVEMEEELRSKITDAGKTRVIVRRGDPMDLTDLEMASPHAARSVIILTPEDTDDPDSVVIKTALALTNNPNRKAGKYHIVGEIQNRNNLEAARLIGKDEVRWILTVDVISRITVQTSRQSGLSVVYTELLDFSGDEIYFSEQPSLVGKTYFETQLAFATSCVMGIVTPDGEVLINPPADTTYRAGDQLILIAEDDSTIELADPGTPDLAVVTARPGTPAAPERALILGYNSALTAILTELDQYVAPGSSVTLVADAPEPQLPVGKNMRVNFVRADTTSRAALESLSVQDFQHIMVLAYSDTLEPHRADARTLITLLHLRDIAEGAGVHLQIVSEMLDDKNRQLAEVTEADDFIVSDKLTSLMLSQTSENAALSDVFESLFSSEGSEVYLRPAENYIATGSPADFYSVCEAARQRGETAIGYRVAQYAHSSAHAYGVTVNPDKTSKRTFAPGDSIIVLAED